MKKFLISILVIAAIATLSIAGARILRNSGLFLSDGTDTPVVVKDPGDPASGKTAPENPDQDSPDAGMDGGQSPAQSQNPPDPGNKPVTPGAGPVQDPNPALLDRKVFSWWFERNSEHKPPRFDTALTAIAEGKGLYLGDTSQKIVYLTFDEGYENGFTPQILDVLKANGVYAAFFVTADFVDKNPELVKRMVAEGHVVGNHTATHPSLPSRTNAEIRSELAKVQEKVKNLTGASMTYMRPPKGEFNGRVLDVAAAEGYKTVFWSMAYRDWETDRQPGRDVALKHVMDNLHPGALILLHAVSSSNAEALDDIIKGVKSKGYSFGQLTDI